MRGSKSITNGADLIDSRDVVDRIAYLEDEAEAEGWATGFPEEAAELAALKALAEEAEGYMPDWTYGATLIRDSYFLGYAKDWAEEIGTGGHNAPWPACHIDWEAAADALKQDYTLVDFDGVEYWAR
jgi:hypothetical protein